MVSQNVDTDCSTPENDTVEKIMKNDAVRYVQKGYGLFFAVCIFLSFFYFGPILLKSMWPWFLSLGHIDMISFLTSFGFPALMFAIANFVMWFIYISEIPFFERYRISPEKEWPWKKDQKNWRVTVKRTLKNVFVNQFIVSPILAAAGIWLFEPLNAYSVDSFPDHFTIIKHITFMIIVEDFLFYWGHRILHKPWFYQRIHKIHHEYYNTISLCAEYAHPLEFLFTNALPTTAGFLLLGRNAHLATLILWLGIRVSETIDGHCGYEFSWSPFRLLPLSGSSEYHSFHHSHNVGSYGSFFTYLDTIFKTNSDYFIHKARKERMQKAKEAQELRKAKGTFNSDLLNQKLSKLASHLD